MWNCFPNSLFLQNVTAQQTRPTETWKSRSLSSVSKHGAFALRVPQSPSPVSLDSHSSTESLSTLSEPTPSRHVGSYPKICVYIVYITLFLTWLLLFFTWLQLSLITNLKEKGQESNTLWKCWKGLAVCQVFVSKDLIPKSQRLGNRQGVDARIMRRIQFPRNKEIPEVKGVS